MCLSKNTGCWAGGQGQHLNVPEEMVSPSELALGLWQPLSAGSRWLDPRSPSVSCLGLRLTPHLVL